MCLPRSRLEPIVPRGPPSRKIAVMHHHLFNNGDRMPVLGLGTWKSEAGEVGDAVRAALEIGYRHIDCALIYGNEPEIGAALEKALADGVVKREELWITSKLWNNAHAPEDVRPAFEQTRRDLRVDYVDLYLIHWPIALKKGVLIPETADQFVSLDEQPIADTWTEMEKLVDDGLAKQIGVSNFSVKKLTELKASARIPPTVNQVEMHPYLQQPELLEWCNTNDVFVTGYAPLGSGDRPDRLRSDEEVMLLKDPTLAAIAARAGITAAQVLLRWALQRGTSVIPKSVNPERLRENLASAEVVLTEQDLRELAALDRGRRYIDGTFWVHPGGPYSLGGIWDGP